MISMKKSTQRGRAAVGLDIDASSIAATELRANGRIGVAGFGIAPLAPGVYRDGEVQDPERLGDAIKAMFAARKLPREVRVGVANQRVAVRTLRLPRIADKSELETAIRFQARDEMPIPVEQSVLDWQVIPSAGINGDQDQLMEVVVVGARRDMIESLIAATRRAGLRLVGIDHSAFALIRALAPSSSPAPDDRADAGMQRPSYLYCNLGDLTNLAVARGSYCLFTRVLNFGIEGIAQSLSEGGGLTLEHARQWLVHVGLDAPVEEIAGNPRTVAATRRALETGTAKLVDELRRSLEYYATLEDAVNVEGVIVAGAGTAIPGLVDRLGHELPLPLHADAPQPLATAAGPAAGRLTLSYGLGLEE